MTLADCLEWRMDGSAEKRRIEETKKAGAVKKKAAARHRDPSDGDSSQQRSTATRKASSSQYVAASDEDSDKQLSTAGSTTPRVGRVRREAPTTSGFNPQQRNPGPAAERRARGDPDASRVERPAKKSCPVEPSTADVNSQAPMPRPVPRTMISKTPPRPIPRITTQPHRNIPQPRGQMPGWVKGYAQPEDPRIRNDERYQYGSTAPLPMPKSPHTYQRQAALNRPPRQHPTGRRQVHAQDEDEEPQVYRQDPRYDDEEMYEGAAYDDGEGYYMHVDEQFGEY